jgi:hypothetical protein
MHAHATGRDRRLEPRKLGLRGPPAGAPEKVGQVKVAPVTRTNTGRYYDI